MYSIKVLNNISEKGLSLLEEKRYDVSESASNPDAILVRSEKLHSMKFGSELKAIGRAGAGVNNIPVDKCTENGVVVFNTPGANANAVKELVLAGLLLSSRNLVQGIEYSKSLKGKGDEIPVLVEKNKSKFKGQEVLGKQLGVIGLGAIGMMVANDAVSFGMKVEGYDPFISVHRAWGLSRAVKPAQSLMSMVSKSDYVSLHMPLTKDTEGLIDKKVLKKFKQGAVLLNFARSEIINEDDVIEALDSGILSLYVNDFPNERLLKHPNVICIPHLGASTDEAETNCAIMAVNQIKDFLEDGNIVNSVNFPDCSSQRTTKHRLVVANKNVPNMVGQMTSILARDGINISEMVNKSRGDLAYNILDLSTKPSAAIVSEIEAIEGVLFVRLY